MSRPTSSDCVFCAIVDDMAPRSVVYEDDAVIAILDIRPVTPGHTLVMPKAHLPRLADLDDETGARMFAVAQRIAGALYATGWHVEGINLFYADGRAALQEVFHAHLHVIPRSEGDSFVIDADWSKRPERTELDTQAAQLSALLGGD